MLLRISNTPRPYAWGMRGAISELLGAAPTDALEAELWLGAHEGNPSRVVAGSDAPDLAAWSAQSGIDVPLLLKVLAIDQPLSLQAHPTPERARAGFAAEEAAGITRDAPDRNYRDALPKPELLVAVSDRVDALAGLRPPREARAALDRVSAHVDAADPGAVAEHAAIARLREALSDDADLGAVIAGLLTTGADADLLRAITRAASHEPALAAQSMIAEHYANDPGLAVSLLAHHVVLARGEAVYLPAGNLHAYLGGIGVELMVASDNVLRGGLTSKHIDVSELLAVLDPTPAPPPVLVGEAQPDGTVVYDPGAAGSVPDPGIRLTVVSGAARIARPGVAIALCLEGEFVITDQDGNTETLARGDAVLADDADRGLAIEGQGLLAVGTR